MEWDRQKLVGQQDDCELLDIDGSEYPEALLGAEGGYPGTNTAQNLRPNSYGVVASEPGQPGYAGVQYGHAGAQYGHTGAHYGPPQQQQQQMMVAIAPSQTATPPPQSFGCVMCFAIFTCICCCWPLGIGAIVYACRARDNSLQGNYQLAQSSASTSRVFSIIALIVGLLVWAASIATTIYFTMFALDTINSMDDGAYDYNSYDQGHHY